MYSNVDYRWLRDTAKSSLDALSSHSLDSVLNSLSGNNVLPSEIRSKVSQTVKDIHNNTSLKGSVAALKFNLNKLIQAADKIQKYQEKDQEIQRFVQKMDDEDEDDRRKLRKMKKELDSLKSSIDKILTKKQGSLF